MKENNALKRSLIMLGMATSLTLTGCRQNKEEAEEVAMKKVIEHVTDDIAINPIEIDEIMIFKIEDLYVNNVPRGDGTVSQRIFCKTSEKIEDGKKYVYFVYPGEPASGSWVCEANIISCEEEWWLPDYNISTVTPLSTYLKIKNMYLDKDALKLREIKDVEGKLNSTNFAYDANHTYKIEDLILVNAEGQYSLYSNERFLAYTLHTNEKMHPLYYFFDITDYKNALRVELNMDVSEYQGEIIYGQNGNVKDYEITSLDSNYAYSLKDKEKEIELGGWQKVRIAGFPENTLVYMLYKYLTEEQMQRGYITQTEAEELIRSLNERQDLKIIKENK